MSAHHSRLSAVGSKSRATRSGAVRTPWTRIVVLPRRRLICPTGRRGASAARRACARRGCRPPGAARRARAATRRSCSEPAWISAIRPLSARRRPPARDGVARCPGVKARARDAEHAAHGLDRVLGLLRGDEPEHRHRVPLSLAKKTAAFFKISRSSVEPSAARAATAAAPRARRCSGPRPRPASTSICAPSCAATAARRRARRRAAAPTCRCALSSATASRRNSNRIRRQA